jgi:uncharacterized protein
VRLENGFEVSAPATLVWDVLNDVPAVVPCMPGAELTETLGGDRWKAVVHVKLGPVALEFEATVTRELVDAAEHRVVLIVDARERRGRGAAHATIDSTLSESEGITFVELVTDLTLKGTVAQYGRGLVPSVAAQLTGEFAANLASLIEKRDEPRRPEPAKPVPVSGLRLLLRTLSAVLRSLGSRLLRQSRAG